MTTMILDVTGMSCQNCVRHVREALAGLSGIDSVEVDLDAGQARVAVGADFDQEAARTALDDAGYEMTGVRAA